MRDRAKRLVFASMLGASVLMAASVRGVPNLVTFQAGQPVSAADFNSNFESLQGSIEALQSQVGTLESDLAEAQGAAGYTKLPNGQTVPFYRTILKGTKTATTTTLAHGVTGNPATQHRFIACQVTTNYTGGQSMPFNTDMGASGAFYCDLDDTNVGVLWVTATTMDYFIMLDYTLATP